jgi:hypothetical protein
MSKQDPYLRGYREVSQNIVQYRHDLDIRNLDAMSKGTGCKYLLCIQGENAYIAKQWKRTPPDKLLRTEFIISFANFPG